MWKLYRMLRTDKIISSCHHRIVMLCDTRSTKFAIDWNCPRKLSVIIAASLHKVYGTKESYMIVWITTFQKMAKSRHNTNPNPSWRILYTKDWFTSIVPRPHTAEALSDDARLTSVAYIGPKQWLKWFCEPGGLTWRSKVGVNPIPIPTPLIWRYLCIK